MDEYLDLDKVTEQTRKVRIKGRDFVVPMPSDIPFGLILDQMDTEKKGGDFSEQQQAFKAITLKILRVKSKDVPDDLLDDLAFSKFIKLRQFIMGVEPGKKEQAEPGLSEK